MTTLFSTRPLREKMAYLSRNNFMLYNQLKKLAFIESLHEEEQNAIAQKNASRLATFASSHSSFYRKLYRSGTSSTISEKDFYSLPTVSRENVIVEEKNLVTSSALFLKKAKTSGTSGSPLSVYRSPGSILRENAYVWNFRMSHGVMPGDPLVVLRPKLDRHTLYRYNKSENQLYLSCYGLSPANIHLYVRLINDLRPKAMIALPSSIFAMANLAEQASLELTLPKVFTSSETLYSFQREKIEKIFHTKVIDWYGNAERTIAMGQCHFGNYHEMPLYSLNEFHDEYVITTSLINSAFPLIRYRVDDTFVHLDSSCKCGKTKGVSTIDGRYEDAVVTPEGTHVNALGMAFRGIPYLQYAQIIQEELGSIKVNLVTTPLFTQKEEKLLLSLLRDRLPDSMHIYFNSITEDEIIKTKSGKFTLIISRLWHGT